MPSFPVTLWHNPRCGTSRSALALIRAAGIEPEIIDYLKTPPDLAALTALAAKIEGGALSLLRVKEPRAAELGLAQAEAASILAAIAAEPALFNRPVVESPKGCRACRPAEMVLGLLP